MFFTKKHKITETKLLGNEIAMLFKETRRD